MDSKKYKKEMSNKVIIPYQSAKGLNRHKLIDERLKRSLEIFEQIGFENSSQESIPNNNKCGKNNKQSQSSPQLSPLHTQPHINQQTGVFRYVYNSQSSTCSINSVNNQIKYSIDTTEYESIHEDPKSSNFDKKFEEIKFKIELIEKKIESIQEKLLGIPLDIFAKPSISQRRIL